MTIFDALIDRPASTLSDEQIIAIRKAVSLQRRDLTKPWADSIMFARAILAAAKEQ